MGTKIKQILRSVVLKPIKCARSNISNSRTFSKAITSKDDKIATIASTNRTISETIDEIVKTVRFNGNDEVYTTTALRDYTKEEIVAAWFTDDEYAKISRLCNKQIRKLGRKEQLEEPTYCLRGLEVFTKLSLAARSQNRVRSIDTVLDEQMIGWEKGTCDFEKIARMYHNTTASSQMWANVVGLRDQRVVDD
jgi:hypothetical protein